MENERLDVLVLAPFAPTPALSGAHRRVEGLITALSRRRHSVTVLSVVADDVDVAAAKRAMHAYADEVVVLSRPDWDAPGKRSLQARSLLSSQSLLRRLYDLPALRTALDRLLSRRAFDIVHAEFPFLASVLASCRLHGRRPRLVLDEHNIEFDLARQQAKAGLGLARRVYQAIDWRKIRREEMNVWAEFDGVAFCSAADEARARRLVPSVRAVVVPNAVDVEYFKPRPGDPPRDGETVLFFGTVAYFPNEDGILFFLREIWPSIEKANPRARLRIVGPRPTAPVLAHRGPRIEITGPVPDLRPYLASAAVSIAPLRIGGGTRFKILEAMAMETPVVSTSVGAEGIDARSGEHLVVADDPAAFAGAVCRVLADRAFGDRIGASGRALVERAYSWDSAAAALEAFYRQLVGSAPAERSSAYGREGATSTSTT